MRTDSVLGHATHGMRSTKPPGFTIQAAQKLLPRLLGVLSWLLDGLGAGPPAGAEETLHALQQALQATVNAMLDPAVAPFSTRATLFELLLRQGYLPTIGRCLGYLTHIPSTSCNSALAQRAHTALATMEALQSLLRMLQCLEAPGFLQQPAPCSLTEPIYSSIALLLPRLASLTLAAAEAGDRAEDGACTAAAPCLASVAFGAIIVLLGGRLAKIPDFGLAGPLPSNAAKLMVDPSFLALCIATLASCTAAQRALAERELGIQLLVPCWHLKVPRFSPLPGLGAVLSRQDVGMLLSGMQYLFQAAQWYGVIRMALGTHHLKLFLEACELSQALGASSSNYLPKKDGSIWRVLYHAIAFAPSDEATRFVEEAAQPLVDVIGAGVEAARAPCAGEADAGLLKHMAGVLGIILVPQNFMPAQEAVRWMQQGNDDLHLWDLPRRTAVLFEAGQGKLLRVAEAMIRCTTASSTLHVSLLSYAMLLDTAPKMLHTYMRPRIAQQAYSTIGSLAKWLLATTATLQATAGLLQRGTNVASDFCAPQDGHAVMQDSMQPQAKQNWEDDLSNAQTVACQLAQLAEASILRALCWLDERLVPEPVGQPTEHLPAIRAAELELLCRPLCQGVHAPHTSGGGRCHSAMPAGSSGDVAAGVEQLGRAVEAQQQRQELRRQQRKERASQSAAAHSCGPDTVASAQGSATPDAVGSSAGGGSNSSRGSSSSGTAGCGSDPGIAAGEAGDSGTAVPPQVAVMALFVACRAGGATAGALPGLRRLAQLQQVQFLAANYSGSHLAEGMAKEWAESQHAVVVMEASLECLATTALKLSALLCPRLPPSQAQVLSTAASNYNATATSNGSSSGGSSGHVQRPKDWWLPVATALQHMRPPKPVGCWNPGCSDLEGACEAELHTLKCAGCRARYCCRACQKAAWKVHKEVCGSGSD